MTELLPRIDLRALDVRAPDVRDGFRHWRLGSMSMMPDQYDAHMRQHGERIAAANGHAIAHFELQSIDDVGRPAGSLRLLLHDGVKPSERLVQMYLGFAARYWDEATEEVRGRAKLMARGQVDAWLTEFKVRTLPADPRLMTVAEARLYVIWALICAGIVATNDAVRVESARIADIGLQSNGKHALRAILQVATHELESFEVAQIYWRRYAKDLVATGEITDVHYFN